MTDIIKRLCDLRERFIFQGGGSFAVQLADEIESLRKRVKELEEENKQLCYKSIMQLNELAALKQSQGETVAQFRKHGCSDWYDGYPDNDDCGGPYETRTLYISAPTIPEGWQLVNKQAIHDLIVTYVSDDDYEKAQEMLSAAPKPENE